MEPMIVTILSTTLFGVVTALSVFIRHLLASRDKGLNNKAQERALSQGTQELKKMCTQIESYKRFDSHYQVLGANKDAIQYLDQKIEEVLDNKLRLTQRYAQVVIRVATIIIEGYQVAERMEVYNLLRQEIEQDIKFYDGQMLHLQARRVAIWDTHAALLAYLVTDEKLRNETLDMLYQSQSVALEKIYLRHNENAKHIALKFIETGDESFKFLITPLQLLPSLFSASNDILPEKAADELLSRKDVADIEKDINGESECWETSPNKFSVFPVSKESFSDFLI